MSMHSLAGPLQGCDPGPGSSSASLAGKASASRVTQVVGSTHVLVVIGLMASSFFKAGKKGKTLEQFC